MAMQGQKLALIGPAVGFDGTSTGSYLGNYNGCTGGPGQVLVRDARRRQGESRVLRRLGIFVLAISPLTRGEALEGGGGERDDE